MGQSTDPEETAQGKASKESKRPVHCKNEPFGCLPRSWQRRIKRLGGGFLELQVIHVLASYTDARTGRCFPTIETLAEDCDVSIRSVQMALRFLESEKVGIIKTVKRGGRGRGTEYELLV